MEIKELPTWHGKAFRVGEPNQGLPRKATARDVVNYEQDELGNDYHIPQSVLEQLGGHPYSDVVWVCKTKQDARRYLANGDSDRAITTIDNLGGSPIIAEDGDGGYLVLKDRRN